MYVEKKLAVTLDSGRSHVVRLPEGLDAAAAAEALCGLRSAAEVGWPEGEAEWLAVDDGDGWLRRSAIAEIELVDWAQEPVDLYG